MEHEQPSVAWPDDVDEILAGDLVVAVGSPHAQGRRRAQRRHAARDAEPLDGHRDVATVRADLSQAERDDLAARAATQLGQVATGRFWDRWLAVYYRDRVCVDVRAQRVVWWPTGAVRDDPRILGAPSPAGTPASQTPPRDAATPRVAMRKVRRVTTRPHLLLGFLEADGMPRIVPVDVASVGGSSVILDGGATPLPPGSRRAGLLAHDFRAGLVGLRTATHTGWLVVDGRPRWTPHTRHSFAAPPNKTLLLLGNGAAARWGYRRAVRHGRDQILQHGS